VDVDAAQAAIQASEQPIRVVFMVHPNSPTANALSETELTWMQQLPTNILVAIDEAYFEFSQQTTVAEVLTRPNWVVTRTFSKAFRLAAHRVGYSVASARDYASPGKSALALQPAQPVLPRRPNCLGPSSGVDGGRG
jgi:histidinol-phosphate aminotransferase